MMVEEPFDQRVRAGRANLEHGGQNAVVEVLDRLVAEFGGCLKQVVQSGDGADAWLHRDQKQVRGDERVVGEQAQDRRTIQDDVVVVVLHVGKGAGQPFFPANARLQELGRFGEPGDVGGLVRFLAGPGARYITGQVVAVDGGMAI